METASVDESVWKREGTPGTWSRARLDSGADVFYGKGSGYESDSSLVSPPLVLGMDKPFVIRFVHSHTFETSFDIPTDGGVIELSIDGGAVWQDVSKWVDPGYGDLIYGSQNALEDRPAYVGQSVGFPALIPVTLDLGMQLKGKTVQVRFRLATNHIGGSFGWAIDDVQVDGTVNLPFTGVALSKPALTYSDADGDGYGSLDGLAVCPPPATAVTVSGDCNPADKAVYPGATERCDGVDNDCDNADDEDWTLGGACSSGVGACTQEGTTVCSTDGLGTACSAVAKAPGDEVCDGVDNDCDGSVDEGFGLGEVCTVGTGPCAVSGVTTCGTNGDAQCSAKGAATSGDGCDPDTGTAEKPPDAGDGSASTNDVQGGGSASGPGAPTDAGGCSTGPSTHPGAWVPVLLLIAALALLRRRRLRDCRRA